MHSAIVKISSKERVDYQFFLMHYYSTRNLTCRLMRFIFPQVWKSNQLLSRVKYNEIMGGKNHIKFGVVQIFFWDENCKELFKNMPL